MATISPKQQYITNIASRGAMGNIVRLQEGEKGPGGLGEAHGVLHRLSAHDFAQLTAMEHEYRWHTVCFFFLGGHLI